MATIHTSPTRNPDPIVRTADAGREVFYTTSDGKEHQVRGLHKFDTEGREFAFDGAVRQDGSKEIKECKRCGVPVVEVTSRRTGNDYKVGISQSHSGYWFYMKHNVHTCDADAAYDFAAMKAATALWAQLSGVVCVGAYVTVVKGRKFPIGTEGTVIWLADKVNAYNEFRAGVKKEDGEVIWINAANIERIDGGKR